MYSRAEEAVSSPLSPNGSRTQASERSLNDLNCVPPVILRNLNFRFYERSFLSIGIFGFSLGVYDCILEKK
jgi:hypothetical protein